MPAALVTGASRGIGLALMAELAGRGFAVTGTVRAAGAARPGRIVLDVRDPASLSTAAETLGPIALDLLVCNAGVYLDGELGKGRTAGEVWAETFAVNVTGVLMTVQAFLPALRRAKGAKIAVISSQMGSTARAPGGSLAYRASKAAALNLGRNLASDLRAEGIAVGIYHPGWVRTDMGGSGADIEPEASARGLADRFAALSPATSGSFETSDARTIPF